MRKSLQQSPFKTAISGGYPFGICAEYPFTTLNTQGLSGQHYIQVLKIPLPGRQTLVLETEVEKLESEARELPVDVQSQSSLPCHLLLRHAKNRKEVVSLISTVVRGQGFGPQSPPRRAYIRLTKGLLVWSGFRSWWGGKFVINVIRS